LQPPGADQPRVPSPSPTRVEIFPSNNDKPPPEWLKGPPTGISLDEAIYRLIHDNLDLRARYSDISQADADVLTSSLRSNPIVYGDANGVPYGAYNRAAGPLQYDVNFVYPIDVSHKRQARTRSAVAARMVIEASYRDAVRLTIGLLYQAYVDALAAQVVISSHAVAGNVWSEIDVDEPQSALKQAQQSLALLINVPAAEIHDRQLFGQLQFRPLEERQLDQAEPLVRLAFDNRPDLQAQRLAVSFAEANINAVLANRFDDVLLLYQPYTFHDGRQGMGTNNSLSWTVGVTVPLPLYNRQQGNLLKARQAADQARTRLV
jgi:cobalt-zinc-cadmium efflux system outer membrane protein